MKNFKGIVVVGTDLADVQSQYISVARGQDVVGFEDEAEQFIMLSSSNSVQSLNPITGQDDLVENDSIYEDMEFVSEASGTDAVDVHYTICTAGCNGHVMADNEELLQHCPACAAVLPDLSEEEIAAYCGEDFTGEASSDEEDECEECRNSIVAVAHDRDSAAKLFRTMVTGETEPDAYVKAGGVISAIAGADVVVDCYLGKAASFVSEDEAKSLEFEAVANADGEVEAHLLTCSNHESCASVIVTDDDMLTHCPACASVLLDEEDEDELDEDDLIDEEDEEDDFDDAEDEFFGEASSDEDDEDEDDGDEEDEDLDIEDEEEDEDEEDEVSMSVASASVSRIVPHPRRKTNDFAFASEASNKGGRVAKVTDHADEQPETKRVSFLSVASNTEANAIDMLYGKVNNENSWLAVLNGTPVARATASTANNPNFDSKIFADAFVAKANEGGIDSAIKDFGFRELTAEVDFESYVGREVDRQVELHTAQASAEFDEAKRTLEQRMKSAMAIASSGINKNFFAGLTNPVKDSLITALSSAGIQNAEALVSNVFHAHADAANETLLNKAMEIMAQPAEIQNQFADVLGTVSGGKHESVASVSVGKPVSTEPAKIESTASAKSEESDSFYSRLNNFRF